MNVNRQAYPMSGAQPPSKCKLPQKQNKYIGMTLKEYFKIQTKQQLDEIDQQSQSQLSVGTPAFHQERITLRKQLDRFKNQRKESQCQNSHCKQTIRSYHMKKESINNSHLEEPIENQREFIKLPSIHEQKNKSLSIQSIRKDQKSIPEIPKENHQKMKTEENPANNLTILLKKDDIFKNHITKNMIMNTQKGMQSRVTAISFYHPNNARGRRENVHERAKTQEQIEYAVKKSFVITRYGMMKSNKEDFSQLRKYQKSIKLKKN